MPEPSSSQIIESVEPEVDACPAESKEDARVRAWRYEQFVGLGFHAVAAARLAYAPVDLNAARRLVGLGCPIATAADILL
jgi:hypothetical protein